MVATGKWSNGDIGAVAFMLIYYTLFIVGLAVSSIIFTLSLGFPAVVDYNRKKKKEKHERERELHLPGLLPAAK